MAFYPGPTDFSTIFNEGVYIILSSGSGLSQSTADARYLKLSGGVETGSVNFLAGLTTTTISNGANVFTMPSSSGQLATTSAGVSTPILLNNGTVSAPAYSFSAESGTGAFRNGSGKLTFSLLGVAAFDIGSFINLYGNPLNFVNSGFNATVSSNTLTGNRSIRWPDLSGTVAMISQIPSSSGFVDLTTNQTISSVKTFSSAPVISSITNTGTLTLPTTTGTLALVSQIPSSSGFVDLTTNQTISSVKTFSSAPVISSITNTGTLTLPTTTGTLALVSQIPSSSGFVDTTTNQTVDGIKTFNQSPIIASITNTGILTLPTTTGTLALVSQIPSTAGFVDLTTSQTISGIKTYSSAPVISTITNTGILTLPTTTGTLALVSQIPSTAGFVDLTTSQTISGIKSFSSAPVISTITNTGTLTLPTATGTLALVSQIPTNTAYVDLLTNQTVAGIKTFSSAPVISSITNTGILTLPTTTGTLALVSQIPTNTAYVDLLTNQSVAGIKTFTSNLILTASGSTTPSLSSHYINPTSTAITGASSYYFTYLDSPITVPTTFTGTASTLTIANAPSLTTGGLGYALNILTGNSLFGGNIINSVGTVATPSYSFLGDLATGFYRIGANNIGVSCNGVKQIDISTSNNTFTNKITLPAGTVGTPSLVFTGGTNSGLFFGSSSLKFSSVGVEKLAMSATLTTFSSNQIVIPVGTITVPSISFLGDTTTGFYFVGAGVLGFTCGGAQMLQLSSAALDLKALQFTTGAGSATVPSHSFGLDLSTGLYRVAASTIGFTCGGTKQLDLSATAAQFTPPVFSTNQPYYSVIGGGAQTITTGTDATLTSASIWIGASTTQGPGITFSGGFYTVANAGIYNISASLVWSSGSATGQRTIYIWKNSTAQLSYETSLSSTTVSPYTSISVTVKLAAADTIAIRAYQDSGGNVNISANGAQSFTIARLS